MIDEPIRRVRGVPRSGQGDSRPPRHRAAPTDARPHVAPTRGGQAEAVQSGASEAVMENEGSDLSGKKAPQRGGVAHSHKRGFSCGAEGGETRTPVPLIEGKA